MGRVLDRKWRLEAGNAWFWGTILERNYLLNVLKCRKNPRAGGHPEIQEPLLGREGFGPWVTGKMREVGENCWTVMERDCLNVARCQ